MRVSITDLQNITRQGLTLEFNTAPAGSFQLIEEGPDGEDTRQVVSHDGSPKQRYVAYSAVLSRQQYYRDNYPWPETSYNVYEVANYHGV